MIITFCGHSDYITCEADAELIIKTIEEASNRQCVEFYLGGYGNFDNFARRCAKKYQEGHPDCKLYLITPYIDSNNRKLAEAQELYDDIIYPGLENVPKRFAISRRNEWMVNQADYVIAYISRQHGGAYKTFLYAQKKGKPHTNIYG